MDFLTFRRVEPSDAEYLPNDTRFVCCWSKTAICACGVLICILRPHADVKRRTFIKSLGAVGSIGTVAVGTNAVFATSATVEGTVEAKSISGRGGDESHTVLAHEGTLNIDDEEYRNAFSDWQDITVDGALARQFDADYETVHYNLHVHHETANEKQNVSAGESLAYRTARPDFNSVQVGDSVQFNPTDADVPRIDSLE